MDNVVNAVIVIYNVKLDESAAFLAVAAQDGFSVTIVDNSTSDEILCDNQKQAAGQPVTYLTTRQNLGLSKAYNLALDHIRKNQPQIPWVLTLDQDTTITSQYLQAVLTACRSAQDTTVFYPTVYAKNTILSPTVIDSRLLQGTGFHSMPKNPIVCINSGLVIKLTVFEQCSYDESLFLDMTDYDFFFQLLKSAQPSPAHLNVSIEQDFSGAGFSTYAKDLHRYKIYTRDFKTFCAKWQVPAVYRSVILLKRAVKLALHYKNPTFLIYA